MNSEDRETRDASATVAEQEQADDEPRNYVVGVGASAGGLEALEALFEPISAEIPAAFVVQQHLSPDFASRMQELLARHTRLHVETAQHGVVLEIGCIYVAPPAKKMMLMDGKLILADRDQEELATHPIDYLFRSIAQDVGARAVGIVLSGTGSDGSRGVQAIAKAGGLVLVQDPESASFDGMPRAALATEVCDSVLPPGKMGAMLEEYFASSGRSRADITQEMDVDDLESGEPIDRILRMLRKEYGIDFNHYKEKTVFRRIERRLSLSPHSDLEAYATYLHTHPEERRALYHDMLIGVTRFFRDEEAFVALAEKGLAALSQREDPKSIRAWIAGCATGEEAYSLAIVLDEHLRARGIDIPLKIFATDVDRRSLVAASSGRYPAEALGDMSEERKSRYFRPDGDGYRVNKRLRHSIVFANHDVVSDAPFTRLDLVSCRNLLIYLQPGAQKKVLTLFHFALRVGGILFLGSSETPGELRDEFQTIDAKWHIFSKRRDIRIPQDTRLPVTLGRLVGPHVRNRARGRSVVDPRLATIYDELLSRYMAPSLLVDSDFQLVHAFGGAEKYLRVRAGRVSNSILDLVDEAIEIPLSAALQRVERDGRELRYTGLEVTVEGALQPVRLTIRPVRTLSSQELDFLIMIEEEEPRELLVASDDDAPESMDPMVISRDHMDSLESELRFTKENLQATIEELETSNEELQATNEELVASNEELQSTNEELQSVNEELHSVNAELQENVEQLTEMTDDMDRLLECLDIGVLFLDHELRVRKFNPAIAKVFHLLPADVHRRFDHFAHTIMGVDLGDAIQEVVRTGEPIEQEVVLENGRRQLLRVLPHAPEHGRPDGALLTLIDVEKLRATESDNKRLSAIVENTHVAIIGYSLECVITSWNASAERLYGYSTDEAVGRNLVILFPRRHGDEFHEISQAMARGELIERETQRLRKDGSIVDVAITASPVRDGRGQIVGGSEIARDISARKQAERTMRDALRQRDLFMATLSHELRNPLMGMLTAATILQRDRLDADNAARAGAVIARQTDHMARLLDDLLDITRLQKGGMQLRTERLDLRSIIDVVLDEIASRLEEGQQVLDVDVPNEPVTIVGDVTRLRQLLVNLLTNAIKHTPAGKKIRVRIMSEADSATLIVRDEGSGMSPETLEQAFEPFVRFADDDAPEEDNGLGLGLAVVRAIVRAHGGDVRAISHDGAQDQTEEPASGDSPGIEFIITLPCQPTVHDRVDEDSTPVLSVNNNTLLLVEDQVDNLELMQMALTERGYQVTPASNAEQAIARFTETPTAIAIVDIGLPDDSGCAVARRIRDIAGTAPLLIALTGYGQQSDREEIMAAGFNHHLIKPTSVDALCHVIESEREPS